MRSVVVPPERFGRWVDGFVDRHGPTTLTVSGQFAGTAEDDSWFVAEAPFGVVYDGPARVADFVSACVAPSEWNLLLVRKGGFAVGRVEGEQLIAHKVERTYVQGRTKAGGQSQQRFARRRDNQAAAAYAKATEVAARVLGPGPILVGGDSTATDQVLTRLGRSTDALWLPLDIPEPRLAVLRQALDSGRSVQVQVHNHSQ